MAYSSDSARTKTWGTEVLLAADLHAQLDLLHSWVNAAMNGSTGHGHTGGTNDGKLIVLTTAVTGILPVANGGTGLTTAAAQALVMGNLLYPIGSLYMNDAVSTNPATLLGFGTWTAISDRIIIGVGATYTPAQATGGAATVTISQANLPSYNLSVTARSAGGDGTNFGTSATGGSSQSLSVPSGGSGTALNVMNPYYAAYIWRRAS